MNGKYFLKIAEGLDIAPLMAELEAQPELWDQHEWRKKIPGGPHSQMTDIWIRYNDIRPYQAKGDYRGFTGEHDSVWYPAYAKLPALRGLIYPLMAMVEGERLGGVLITRIPPGHGIGAHVDAGWHVEYYDKFYISLKSAPGAKFICHHGAGEVLEPAPGECWRFDNRFMHSVKNESTADRITLIVCIRTQRYQDHGASHAQAA